MNDYIKIIIEDKMTNSSKARLLELLEKYNIEINNMKELWDFNDKFSDGLKEINSLTDITEKERNILIDDWCLMQGTLNDIKLKQFAIDNPNL